MRTSAIVTRARMVSRVIRVGRRRGRHRSRLIARCWLMIKIARTPFHAWAWKFGQFWQEATSVMGATRGSLATSNVVVACPAARTFGRLAASAVLLGQHTTTTLADVKNVAQIEIGHTATAGSNSKIAVESARVVAGRDGRAAAAMARACCCALLCSIRLLKCCRCWKRLGLRPEKWIIGELRIAAH